MTAGIQGALFGPEKPVRPARRPRSAAAPPGPPEQLAVLDLTVEAAQFPGQLAALDVAGGLPEHGQPVEAIAPAQPFRPPRRQTGKARRKPIPVRPQPRECEDCGRLMTRPHCIVRGWGDTCDRNRRERAAAGGIVTVDPGPYL